MTCTGPCCWCRFPAAAVSGDHRYLVVSVSIRGSLVRDIGQASGPLTTVIACFCRRCFILLGVS